MEIAVAVGEAYDGIGIGHIDSSRIVAIRCHTNEPWLVEAAYEKLCFETRWNLQSPIVGLLNHNDLFAVDGEE